MSYSLFYDKQFVKLNDNLFIPMILAGDSNCYDHSGGNARRSRSWGLFAFVTRGKLACSLEEMLEKQSHEKDTIEGSGLRIGGSYATYGTYIGFTKTGCNKALTIEQLKGEGVLLNIHTWYSEKSKEILREQGLEPVNFTPNSTQDVLDFLENVAPKYKEAKEGTLYVTYSGMYDSKPKYLRARYFPQTKTEVKKVEVLSRYGYAIEIIKKETGGTYGYLYSYRGGSFRYASHETGGKQFIDKKEAETWMKKIAKRRSMNYDFKVIVVDYFQDRRFYVKEDKVKNLVLPEPEPEVRMTDEELIASLVLRPEGEEVKNMFDPEQKCFLDPLGVALHDFIKGCEYLNKHDKMHQALGIFRERYPEEYMVLLD